MVSTCHVVSRHVVIVSRDWSASGFGAGLRRIAVCEIIDSANDRDLVTRAAPGRHLVGQVTGVAAWQRRRTARLPPLLLRSLLTVGGVAAPPRTDDKSRTVFDCGRGSLCGCA